MHTINMTNCLYYTLFFKKLKPNTKQYIENKTISLKITSLKVLRDYYFLKNKLFKLIILCFIIRN